MSNIPQSLTDKLEVFLATRSESDGGYAPVDRKDIGALHDILREIVEAKYEADPDGDRPINWELIDRTKYEPSHFRPVRYRHQASEIENPVDREFFVEEVLEGHLFNLSQAMSRVDTEMRVRQHHRHEQEKRAATFKPEQKIRLTTLPDEAFNTDFDEPVADHLTVGEEYKVGRQHSFRSEGVEYVRIEATDKGKPFTIWPVSCFEPV